jgi:adenylate cyclase
MTWQTSSVLDWLVRDGRKIVDGKRFIEQLGRRLIDSGAPLWRTRLGCRTIHPQFAALSFTWSSDMARATEIQPGHGFRGNDSYIGSPFQHVAETGAAFRRRLVDLKEDSDHRLLFELAAEGATDYLALPMAMTDGANSNFVVVTEAAQGFTEQDIAQFEELALYIAPVFEVLVFRRLARTILNTYVGPRTAERVLSGQIKRGDGEVIHAAIWFCDLRDFTALTERLEAKELLELLNAYFEAVAAAVTARGGEVLKFIGDAMLVVFPVSETASKQQACMAALDAAEDAFAGLATLNLRRKRAGQPPIRIGLGLHLGEVIYGNVGAPDRLDFTVMGPAVNKTARLEGLTKDLGVSVLMSSEFAALADAPARSLGHHDLKGVSEQQEIFAWSSEA